MSDISLPFGGDCSIDEEGDPILVEDFDETTEFVERFLLTNPERVYNDGSYVPPDCIYHPDFGLGFRSLLGHLAEDGLLESLKLKATQACMGDDSIKSVEQIAMFQFGHDIQTYIDVQTTDGRDETIRINTGDS